MKAFTVNIKDFFKLDSKRELDSNFNPHKKKFVIPMYQREFAWTNEKIDQLLQDILQRDKFLGIVILDESNDHYDIIDGQQRITTCYLTLLCLYNLYEGAQHEQDSIRGLLLGEDNKCILLNDSVGRFVQIDGRKMNLSILHDADIYFQQETFERAYQKIFSILEHIFKQGGFEALRAFRRKLYDCEFLVLIQNEHQNTRPVEQIFLDINEKAQLLTTADIFKGHCFENYDEEYDEELKAIWVQLKKCSVVFSSLFSFKDFDQYIYLFFLIDVDRTLPENLSPNGKHYLEGKSMDETEQILKKMIDYGNAVITFKDNLSNNQYYFEDLCPNSMEYRNTADHQALKEMSLSILEGKQAQYQKLPFMYFIYVLSGSKTLQKQITHEQLRKIISNYYIYATLFRISPNEKSKKNIDYTLKDALKEEAPIPAVIASVQALRANKVQGFDAKEKFNAAYYFHIYSIIDNYIANKNFVNLLYSRKNHYNIEHFIIPDGRKRIINWLDGKRTEVLTLPKEFVGRMKPRTINYIVTEEKLNEYLDVFDVVTKITRIKEWYKRKEKSIPTHVDRFIKHIESLPQYNKIVELKGTQYTKEHLEQVYMDFLNSYFSDAAEYTLLLQIKKMLVGTFHNNGDE